MRYLLIFIVAALCSGCSPTYIAPKNGPIATVHYINKGGRNLEISYYEISESCQRRRSTDTILPGAEVSHRVYANRNLTFQFLLEKPGGGLSAQYCLMNLRFSPIENHEYKFSTSDGSNSCLWEMVDTTDKDAVVPINLEVILWKNGWSEDSSFCSK